MNITLWSGPNLPIGYVGISLGPQDPRELPENCGTHKVNCLYTGAQPGFF